MDIVWRDWVGKIVDIVASKHLVFFKTCLIAMPFWESLAFVKIKKCLTETAFVVVLNV